MVDTNDKERFVQAANYLEFCHGNEIKAYEFLHSEARKQNIKMKIPEFYYGADFSINHNNGLIIMEDLSEVGRVMRLVPGLRNKQVENVVEEMAKIHLLSLKNPEFVEMKTEKTNWDSFIPIAKSIAQKLRDIDPDIFNPLMDKIERFYDQEIINLSFYKKEKYGKLF